MFTEASDMNKHMRTHTGENLITVDHNKEGIPYSAYACSSVTTGVQEEYSE